MFYINPHTLKFTQTIRDINMDKIDILRESMRTNGFIEDYAVELVGGIDGYFYVSEGHHRVIAAIYVGIEHIPYIILQTDWVPFVYLNTIQYDYEDLITNIMNRKEDEI